MTLDEIDALLAEWRTRLQRVDENLLALEREPAWQLVEGAPLEGVTREKVAPALTAMRDLFEQRGRLNEVVERAAELRRGLSRLWPSERTLDEIARLLTGPSVRLEVAPTPLAQRGLLTAGEHESTTTPEALLAAMLSAYDTARETVMAVDAAWSQLHPALEAVEAELATLQSLARSVGSDAIGALDAVQAEVQSLRTRVARDPIGARAYLDGGVLPRLRQARERLSVASRERDAACAAADRARSLWQELRTERAAGRAAHERYRREIAGAATATPVDDALIDGLEPWLATLEGALGSGRWHAAAIGLTRWIDVAEGYLAQERAARTAAASALATREELLGRLSARRAQLQSLMFKGHPIDPSLDERAHAVEALLRHEPVPLDSAQASMEQFEAALRQALKRNP